MDSEQFDPNEVYLSLDPNLIYVNNAFPNPNYGSEEGGENEDVDMEQAEQVGDEGNTDASSKFHNLKHLKKSLVNNPYETYGSLPLNEFIPLILRQRGIQFSDLTNEYLDMELATINASTTDYTTAQAKKEDMLEDGEITAESENFKENVLSEPILPNTGLSIEEFNKVKQEIFDSINMALNESSLSLELVSLLLTGVRNRQGMATMSPFLKSSVPPGSLNSEKVGVEKLSQAAAAAKYDTSIGWKLRSLKEANKLLKENYTKLKSLNTVEQNFWSIISNNLSDGDAVFKMRDRTSGEKSLGVQYGYNDSGSTYTGDKGIAILKTIAGETKGSYNLELVPINRDSSKDTLSREINIRPLGYYVKVKIYSQLENESDYILTGESFLDSEVVKIFKQSEIENNIKAQFDRLKFTVFEQELVYQMRKETNELFKYGCSIDNENKLSCEIAQEKFEIELLPIDLDLLDTFDQVPPKTNDHRANIFLSLLRMLLVVMFKKKLLHDRTQQPLYVKESGSSSAGTSAMASGPSSSVLSSDSAKSNRANLASNTNSKSSNAYRPPLLLIKPLLGQMRHNHYHILLKKIVQDCILNTVPESKISNISTVSSDMKISNYPFSSDSSIEGLQSQLRVFDPILNIPTSTMDITLPNDVVYKLTLQSPNYCGILIQLSVPNKDILEFTEFKELEDYLNYSISLLH